MGKTYWETIFQCQVCGKATAGRTPRQGREVGDGTLTFPRRHQVDGQTCSGIYKPALTVNVEAHFDAIRQRKVINAATKRRVEADFEEAKVAGTLSAYIAKYEDN